MLVVIQIAVMVVLAVLVYQGWALAWNALPQVASTVEVSLFYIFLAVPIGSALMLTVALELMLRQAVAIRYPSGFPDEPTQGGAGGGWT